MLGVWAALSGVIFLSSWTINLTHVIYSSAKNSPLHEVGVGDRGGEQDSLQGDENV